jgi:hypothetical protein
VGVSSGQEPEVLWAAGAAVVVKDFHQLLDIMAAQKGAAAVDGRGTGGKQEVHVGLNLVANTSTGVTTH